MPWGLLFGSEDLAQFYIIDFTAMPASIAPCAHHMHLASGLEPHPFLFPAIIERSSEQALFAA